LTEKGDFNKKSKFPNVRQDAFDNEPTAIGEHQKNGTEIRVNSTNIH
jgi:hypothetical protein